MEISLEAIRLLDGTLRAIVGGALHNLILELEVH
jgi:hypothetical protein